MTIEEIEKAIDWFKNCVQEVERCHLSEEVYMIERMHEAREKLKEAIKQHEKECFNAGFEKGVTGKMTIEEIEGLIESYVKEIELAEQAIATSCDYLEHAYNMGSIKNAYDDVVEAIIEYGRESAAEAFELGRKSAKEHVT